MNEIVHQLRFSLSPQDDDGSWPVHGVKANRMAEVQETPTYWGTTWAVMALATILPPHESNAAAVSHGNVDVS